MNRLGRGDALLLTAWPQKHYDSSKCGTLRTCPKTQCHSSEDLTSSNTTVTASNLTVCRMFGTEWWCLLIEHSDPLYLQCTKGPRITPIKVRTAFPIQTSAVVSVTLSTELSGLESLGVCHGSDLQAGNLLIVRKLGVVMTQHTSISYSEAATRAEGRTPVQQACFPTSLASLLFYYI